MYNCEAVRNFDDMLGKVDGIISGGYYNYPWNHILHEPYLEAGLPNLINRPFASSLLKARKMIATARKNGATILCPSAYEHTEAIARAKAWVADKKILCYSATNSCDEYPTHGVHGVYMIHWAIAEVGNPIVSVAYQSRNWYSTPGVMTFEVPDKNGDPFLGTLHQINGTWATLQIYPPEEYGGKPLDIQAGTGFPFSATGSVGPRFGYMNAWRDIKRCRRVSTTSWEKHVYSSLASGRCWTEARWCVWKKFLRTGNLLSSCRPRRGTPRLVCSGNVRIAQCVPDICACGSRIYQIIHVKCLQSDQVKQAA